MKNGIEKGLMNLAVGMLIVAELPVVAVKTIAGRIRGEKRERPEIKVCEVDVSKSDPETREWMRRCYEKKNGIVH